MMPWERPSIVEAEAADDEPPSRIVIPDERCERSRCNGLLEWDEDVEIYACVRCGATR